MREGDLAMTAAPSRVPFTAWGVACGKVVITSIIGSLNEVRTAR